MKSNILVNMNSNTQKLNMQQDSFDILKDNYIETPWDIIGSYFQGQHLDRFVRHQLESYNNFIGYQIIKTIEMFNPVRIASEQDYDPISKKHSLEIFITFENFQIYRPQIHENNGAIKLMFPQEARLRNFTYASATTIDINIKYIVRSGENLENVQTFYNTIPKIHMGKLPIMLKSNICVLNQYKHFEHTHTGECKYDAGGYFIINGSEKTVLGQERAAENRVYCFNVSKNNTKYTWIAEVKSVPDSKCISPKQISVMLSSKNNGFGNAISIQIPRIKQPIPLFTVFRALGVITDKEICEKILLDINNTKNKEMLSALQASIIESNKHLTQEDAIKYITSFAMYTPINMDKETGIRKKSEFTLDILNNDLFPHCNSLTQKIYFLGYMANKLLLAAFEIIKQDDRDSYVNKRVDLTGTLLNNLFRNYFNKVVKDMEKQVIREINTGSWKSKDDYVNIINLTNIYKIIKSTTIENGIKRALSTGDFGIKHANSNKVGVAQVLNRLNYVSSLSHARRISTPTDKSGKLIPPRKLHNTSWGFLCCAETPEGQSVGIVKNLSYMTHLTIYSNSLSLYEYIMPHILPLENENIIINNLYEKVKVFINGAWVGITDDPYELYSMLKDKKFKGIINIYTSIIFDYKMKEIRVCNDSGRLTRPLLRVKDKNILITPNVIKQLNNGDMKWDDLLTSTKIEEAIIEYVDAEEQSWSLIATTPSDIIKTEGNSIYKYTHCEIHPSTIFGILASCIPFPENNQSPRNTYQCLDINETVLLSNGLKTPIKDIKVGDEVVSFNPDTMLISYTKVVNHYIKNTTKKIYKITTLSGREIIATEDHKFMTTNGWCEVKNMFINETMIGIMPYQDSTHLNDDNYVKEILTEDTFRNLFIEYGFNLNYINKHIEQLIDYKLLPLNSNNYKIPIVSRIFGFLLADGSINLYERNGNKFVACSFDFGTEKDVSEFENDVKLCGFNTCKYNKGTRECNGTFHTTYSVTHNGVLPALLIALGISYGKKTENERKCIPDWIMNGSKLIKREFLSGFQGGDGCKIRWNKIDKGYNFICAETSQQINPKLKKSLEIFMEQCIKLFGEFDIEVSGVKRSVVSNDRVKISYKISDKHKNLIKYFNNIGYRYCSTKNTESAVVIEYLKYKEILFEEHKKFIELVRRLNQEGNTNTTISNKLNITVGNVSDIVKSLKKGRKISMRNIKEDNIETWIKSIIVHNNMLFMPVNKIEEVENRLISDITVDSENHSFIAGKNFLSSNCAQGKQAMGVYVTNYENRMDKTAYVLNYPMRPLVDTRIMNMIQLNKIPSGSQLIVAIMTHTGYNQEDSLLINKGSIDRGMALVTVYHTEKDEDKQKINGDEEIRCKPDSSKTKGMKMGNYNKVNSKGVIPENTLVENRDIIISKVTPIKENRNDHTKVIKFEDQSKIYKTVEETYIDKNYIDRNGEGYTFAKVRIRAVRKPVIGDKFCALPTQQVLTNKGWIEIQNIDINIHKVCTLDINGNMTYEFPSAKFEYDHNDKMYSIKNKQVEIVCTLNHKLYVKTRYGKDYQLIEAQDVMGKMVRFQKTMTNVCPDIEFIELGEEEKYKMDDWLQLLGMFIADGWCDKCNKRIFITAIKDRKREFVQSILDNLNVKYNYHKDGNYFISSVKNVGIYNELSILSVGALNKYLPEYVFNLSVRQSKILLEALLQGDGSKMEYKGETFSRYGTISIQLANDISRLALHCGYSGIVKVSEEPTGIARIGKRNLGSRAGQEITVTQQNTYYKVSIITKQNQPWINKKANDSNEEKLIDYEGKVYCIEMPSSHTYYMRERDHSPSLIIGNSSRHGQKGTVGNIIPECDMPFTSSGVRPDIIINPHAIPSRMTIGQLKETLLGKVLVELGLFGDGTSFGHFDIADISKELQKVGYESNGDELLYNGLTGEQHDCSVFMGPVFYQRLKHMVNDKAHSRAIGPMVNLTRQPAEGRSRDGGLRFGEMERDCVNENTEIVMTNGLSIYIKNMENCDAEVLGWDEKTNKLIPSKQSGFMYKGEKECVKLTFEDGRTNICTPEHPILTADNQWIKAKDLLVNQQKVKAGITCPVIDFNEEIKECNGWQLRVGDLLFKTDTKENYIKTLVLAKLIGYLITDGNISYSNNCYKSIVFLGHMIDVNSFLSDLKLLCETKQTNFISKNLYSVRIPAKLINNIVQLDGFLIGKKVSQSAQLPAFILDESCPLPIVREFLGGLFGGDGHTCVLGMHRGKRDILSSISFSQTKNKLHLASLTNMFENIKRLFARFGIVNTTLQNFKETSYSKGKSHIEETNKNYQLTLHLDMNELIPFHDKIGFRYCCHKSQRLEAAVSYKRLRNEVTRQHNWLINRVNEITHFTEIKAETSNKIVPTKKAIIQAVNELKQSEPLIHEYAIPTAHDITDHLIKGTTFGKFTSKSFPTAEEYLKEIGALDWFLEDTIEKDIIKDEEEQDTLNINDEHQLCYGVNRECEGLPTMDLRVIDIRPAGIHKVYDIEVDNTHSFLANGVVAHNCMISHGASRFTKERMYDVSDKYSVFVCKKCGIIASYNDKMHIHHCRMCDNRVDFAYTEIPYACKLLFQELNTMNIAPRFITTDH